MIGNGDMSKRIVKSWPGRGTGETLHETEDGAVWRSDIVLPDHSGATAPPKRGTIIDGRIYPSNSVTD